MGTASNPLPYGLVRQSRIKDRVKKADEKDSSLKIKIELDLEVEVSFHPFALRFFAFVNEELQFLIRDQVELYARVKGDVTIGLM